MAKNPSSPTPSLWGLLRPYRTLVAWLVSTAILGNILSLVLPLLIAHGIDAYSNGTLVVNTLILKFTVVAVIIFFCTYAQSVLQTYTAERVARDLRTDLSAKISRQTYAQVQAADPSKLLTNLTGDIDSVKLFVSQAIVSLISSVVVILGASILLISIEWKLAIAVLALLPLIGGTFGAVFARVRKLFVASREIIDSLNKVINESILGAAIIRVLNTMRNEETKFVTVNSRARDLGYRILNMFAWMIPIVTFFANLATLVILALGGYFVIHGGMTFGDFAAFNSYLAILIFPIFVLGFVSSIMAQASASYGRVAAVLAVPEPTPRGALRPAELRGAITVEHLTLTIGEKNILKDISFSIQQGSKTAIVGPTAAGKSQLLYALIGLIESTSGVVKYDGHAINEYDPEYLHGRIGFVFQESSVFNMSVRENIAFSTTTTDAALARAIDTAELRDVVDGLPEGLDTVISERGTTLSGGQKQRLMLARALALNPSLLFLDDFTARVDARTEAAILKNVEQFYPDMTILSVTQKIASVEHHDQILVLMEGELLAAGTHAQLLETSPEYVQLYEAQRSTHTYEV